MQTRNCGNNSEQKVYLYLLYTLVLITKSDYFLMNNDQSTTHPEIKIHYREGRKLQGKWTGLDEDDLSELI